MPLHIYMVVIGVHRFRRPLGRSNPSFSPIRFTITLILCTLVVLSTIALWWAERQLSGPIREWARLRATTTATSAINSAVREGLADRLDGIETFRVRPGPSRDTPIVSYNMGPLNQLVSDTVQSIVAAFDGHRHDEFMIPLGEVTGLHLLAGRGPFIPARIVATGSVEAEPKVDFFSAGINQIVHRLYIDVTIRMMVIAPFLSEDIIVKQSVIITEDVLPGQVPDTYVNLVGYSGGFAEWMAALNAGDNPSSGLPLP